MEVAVGLIVIKVCSVKIDWTDVEIKFLLGLYSQGFGLICTSAQYLITRELHDLKTWLL